MQKRLVLEAAFGLWHLHERGYTHNDLKENNMTKGAEGFGKLLDFGQTFHHEASNPEGYLYHENCASPNVRSPEADFVKKMRSAKFPLILPDEHRFSGKANDVWCLCFALYRLVLMMPPWSNYTIGDAFFLFSTNGSFVKEGYADARESKYYQMLKSPKVMNPHQNLGILKLCHLLHRSKVKDADGTRRVRYEMITSACCRLMQRVFVPEHRRINIFEFIMDPYFDDIRDSVIQNAQQWQMTRYGNCDDFARFRKPKKKEDPDSKGFNVTSE